MPRAPKQCGRRGCTTLVTGRPYCDQHTAQAQRRDNTTDRGYGAAHQRERARWAPQVATGTVRCWRCRHPIQPGQRWHLGHDDHDRSVYNGPEHEHCNTQAAAISKRARTPSPTNSA